MGMCNAFALLANEARTPVQKAQIESALVITNVEDLKRAGPLSTVAKLVLNTPAQPRGDLLAAVGRMHAEYPELRTFARMDEPPSLPVAIYLASCGVQMSWPGSNGDNQGE
jgi:hypothetical protein